MTELRKVVFGSRYWHVVDDDPDNNQIIGTLSYFPESLLPWRASYEPSMGAPEDLAIRYCKTEQDALEFLEKKVKGEE